MGERYGGEDPATEPPPGGTVDQEGVGGMLDLDRVYAVLNHPRRRLILDIVSGVDLVSIRELAERIAAVENDVALGSVTDEQRRVVGVSLHHVHVPKLTDAGVIRVEDDGDHIRRGPNADQVLAAATALSAQVPVTD